MSQPSIPRLARTASIVGGLLWACLPPVFVYASPGLDKPATAGFALAVTSMWLVGVVSLLLLLLGLSQLRWIGRDRPGRLGEAGLLASAIALGAMALGNGIELYTVTTRGTESEVGHTIFLIAFLGVDGGFSPGGAGLCQEAAERWHSLGWSAPPAGPPARSPAPNSGRGVVARH
jgi:hypothetical protein